MRGSKNQSLVNRVVAIGLGILGLFVILKADQGMPIPKNAGDWMGLISGIFWALAANVMRRESAQNTFDVLVLWFFWAAVFGLILALLPILDRPKIPEIGQIIGILSMVYSGCTMFLIIPGFYAIAWGVPLLNPGTVGILFMTEISVGAIAAALLTDEPFGMREILGVGLITVGRPNRSVYGSAFYLFLGTSTET